MRWRCAWICCRRNCADRPGKILADKIREKAEAKNSGMTTGFLGTRPLLPVLSATGEHDLAARIVPEPQVSVVGVRGGQRGDDHLGALEQLHQGKWLRRRRKMPR